MRTIVHFLIALCAVTVPTHRFIQFDSPWHLHIWLASGLVFLLSLEEAIFRPRALAPSFFAFLAFLLHANCAFQAKA